MSHDKCPVCSCDEKNDAAQFFEFTCGCDDNGEGCQHAVPDCICGCGLPATHRFWGFNYNPRDPKNPGEPITALACCEGYCDYLTQNNAALNFIHRTERIEDAS